MRDDEVGWIAGGIRSPFLVLCNGLECFVAVNGKTCSLYGWFKKTFPVFTGQGKPSVRIHSQEGNGHPPPE